MNKTTNYQLNQWERTDKVQMEDFNADNAKIDAAIRAEADARAAGDAALSAGKADKTALNALQTVVNGKGNCKIVTGTYVGTGEYGKDHPNTLTFPKRPLVLFIFYDIPLTIVYPSTYASRPSRYLTEYFVSWNGNTVSWYLNSSPYTPFEQLNEAGTTYNYIALVEA